MNTRKISLFVCSLFLVFSSCDKYEDYTPDYEYSAVYFGTQKPLRTIVAYDQMTFKLGVTLAGKRENNAEEWVTYVIDPALLTNTSFKLLPAEYYSMSDNQKLVIPKGKFVGDVTVTLNRNAFTGDPLSHLSTYALPLRLTGTSADSILTGKFDQAGGELSEAKGYTILVVKYISPLHGVFYHKGIQKELTGTGQVKEEKTYNTTDLSKNQTWTLVTQSLNEVITQGAGTFVTQGTANYGLSLKRNGDNSVTIEKAPGSLVSIVQSDGHYDEAKREFYLNYKFTTGGVTYTAADTLVLRQAPELDLRFEEWQ